MRKEHIEKMQEQAKQQFGYAMHEAGNYRESWRIFRIMAEFVEGYQFLSELKHEVTILGSARLTEDNPYYKIAQQLGKKLADDGFTIVTGGGPGIMEAANKGAAQSEHGNSIGLNIQLPFEQVINPFVKKSTSFNYFFTRKVMLTSPANAFVFFPGGFGTMDEFFEVVDMMELGFMHHVPIVLIGKEYWQPLIDFLTTKCEKVGSVDQKIVDSWHLVDSVDEAYAVLREHKEEIDMCELSPKSFHCKDNVDWRIFRIMAELVEGFEFITGITNGVTVLGTSGTPNNSEYYNAAYLVGQLLAESEFPVITGGNEGIAEAANKGAYECGGESIGIGMKVRGKMLMNDFVTKSLMFNFPFTRKLVVTAPTKAFVVFPGGFGTLHQLFEILTLVQTKKMPARPIILFDHGFWEPLHDIIKTMFVHELETISDEDDELYQIVDDDESILKILENFNYEQEDNNHNGITL